MKKQTDHMVIRARLVNPRNRLARFYDNGGPEAGGSIDRYTAVYLSPVNPGDPIHRQRYGYVAMSSCPFHPQGFGQHVESSMNWPVDWQSGIPRLGRRNHLGKRILFADLPPDCQRLVVQDLIS